VIEHIYYLHLVVYLISIKEELYLYLQVGKQKTMWLRKFLLAKVVSK